MTVEVGQAALLAGLRDVGRAVAARAGALPVLSDVLLRAEGNTLHLAATDLEIAMVTWLDAYVGQAGAIAVPAGLLGELVASLPAAPVALAVDPGSAVMRVRCARVRASLHGHDPDDFPAILRDGGEPTARIAGPLLREAIGQVVFAAAADDDRPVLRGGLLEFAGGALTLVAGDGFRLSRRSIPCEEPPPAPTSLIVPARALRELARAVADRKASVEVAVSPDGNRALFRCGAVELHARLLEGPYLAYRRAIPTDCAARAATPTATLLRAVQRSAAFATDGGRIRLALRPAEGGEGSSLTLSATGPETGVTEDTLETTDAAGPAMTTCFNAGYLAEALGALRAEGVALELRAPDAVAVLRPAGQATDYIHLLMPMTPVGG
jgi:DNA polymerase-3 subunit beta